MFLVLRQPLLDPLDQDHQDVEVWSPLQDLEDEAASQDQLSSQLKCFEVSSPVTQLRFERHQCVHKLGFYQIKSSATLPCKNRNPPIQLLFLYVESLISELCMVCTKE